MALKAHFRSLLTKLMQCQISKTLQLGIRVKIPELELILIKRGPSHASHVPPFIISGVFHPFLMVVLLLGSDELPSLDPSLTKVCVPRLAFWCLCINVKFPPTLEQHCNVCFIAFISSFKSR